MEGHDAPLFLSNTMWKMILNSNSLIQSSAPLITTLLSLFLPSLYFASTQKGKKYISSSGEPDFLFFQLLLYLSLFLKYMDGVYRCTRFTMC
jgi:hypothetical protein